VSLRKIPPLDFIVLILLAGIAAFAALWPFYGTHSRIVWVLWVVVFLSAVAGIADYIYRARRQDKAHTKINQARVLLSGLLADGQEIVDTVRMVTYTSEDNDRIVDWHKRARAALSTYLDESYLRRFNRGTGPGSEDVPGTTKLNERLTVLEDFLKEIRA